MGKKPNAPRGRGVAAEVVLDPVSVSDGILPQPTDPGQLVRFPCDACLWPVEALAEQLVGAVTWTCPNCRWCATVPPEFRGVAHD